MRILLLCLLLIGRVPLTCAADAPFPDMERSWFRYKEFVAFLRTRDVIQGYPDGNFHPKAAINRAEFLKIVFKARGGQEPVQGNCFSDVPADAWYAPFVCAAERRQIVNGYPDGTFRPEQEVNIAEALKMLLKTYGEDIEERRGEKWYEAYAKVFEEKEILDRASYIPWDPLTRERAADIVVRLLLFEEERQVARRSPGCGQSFADVPLTITVNGIERSFLLTTPENYVAHEPAPIIVAFHGRTNDNVRVRSYYGLDRANDDAFIVYPAALRTPSGSFQWSGPGDGRDWVSDIAFFDALVELLSTRYCIDMDRIFTVGHSLGAWIANSVACIRGDVVRGSATVGGDSIQTNCAGPAAALIIHHQRDALASFSAAERARDLRLKENSCGAEVIDVQPSSLQCREYQGCDGDNPVVWCPHEIDYDSQGDFYTHNWPRDAAGAIMEFFEKLQSL